LIPVIKEDGSVEIQGALCKRGVAFGTAEVTNPMRSLTSTLRIEGGAYPLVPVRGLTTIPKAELKGKVKALRSVKLQAPVKSGDKIIAEGMELVISGSMKKAEK